MDPRGEQQYNHIYDNDGFEDNDYNTTPSYGKEQAKKAKRRRFMKYSIIIGVVILVLAGLFSALGPTEFSKSTSKAETASTEAQSFLASTESDDADSVAVPKIDLADVKDQDDSNAYEENLAAANKPASESTINDDEDAYASSSAEAHDDPNSTDDSPEDVSSDSAEGVLSEVEDASATASFEDASATDSAPLAKETAAAFNASSEDESVTIPNDEVVADVDDEAVGSSNVQEATPVAEAEEAAPTPQTEETAPSVDGEQAEDTEASVGVKAETDIAQELPVEDDKSTEEVAKVQEQVTGDQEEGEAAATEEEKGEVQSLDETKLSEATDNDPDAEVEEVPSKPSTEAEVDVETASEDVPDEQVEEEAADDTNPFIQRSHQAARARFEKRLRHKNGQH